MLAAAVLALAGVAAAQYFPATPTNLLVNAGAESGVTPAVSFQIGFNGVRNGWTVQNGPLSAAGAGQPLTAVGLPAGTTIDPFEGTQFFLTNTVSLTNSLQMTQTFDLSMFAALIDGADCKIQIRGAGFITHPGQAILMQIEFFDAGSASTGTQLEFYTDDMPLADWVQVNSNGLIPALTRTIVVTFVVNCQNPNCALPGTPASAGFDALAANVLFDAGLHGDPHFIGFDGSKFNFDGVSGEVFGIISDPTFELNARFERMVVKGVNGTWITEVGMVAHDFSLVFSPRSGVLVNENVVVSEDFSDANGNVVVVKANNGVVSSLSVEVVSGYSIDITVQAADNTAKYIDMKTHILAVPSAIDGVLGQTAKYLVDGSSPRPVVSTDNQGKGVVAGSVDSYIVKDGILGTSFEHSVYDASVKSIKGKRFAVESATAVVA